MSIRWRLLMRTMQLQVLHMDKEVIKRLSTQEIGTKYSKTWSYSSWIGKDLATAKGTQELGSVLIFWGENSSSMKKEPRCVPSSLATCFFTLATHPWQCSNTLRTVVCTWTFVKKTNLRKWHIHRNAASLRTVHLNICQKTKSRSVLESRLSHLQQFIGMNDESKRKYNKLRIHKSRLECHQRVDWRNH